MKLFKKLLSYIIAFTMVLSLATLLGGNVYAAEGTGTESTTNYTLTVLNNNGTKDGPSTHTFEIYQIFTGDYNGTVLSNIKWGSGVTADGQKDIGDAKAYAENLKTSDNAKAFAKRLADGADGKSYLTSPIATDPIAPGASAEVNVQAGYYLIKDKDGSQNIENGAYTDYIVKVVGNTTATTKLDVPSVVKKVKDYNDTTGDTSNWQDSADYDIGDNVPYQLTGTLPSDYSKYTKYAYTFNDQMSGGLTFNNDIKVYKNSASEENLIPASQYKVTSDEHSFSIKFADLKTVTANASDQIIVTYSAQLNGNAVIGSEGNPNTVNLTYSNNPNNGGEGETGKTPDDKNIVFTYKTVINKVKKDGTSLAGAGFTLYKKVNGYTGESNYKSGYKQVKKFTAGTAVTFEFKGLDDGDYALVESDTPAGYNTMDPIEFSITAEHNLDSENPQLIKLNGFEATGEVTLSGNQKAKVDKTAGSITANVVNYSGSVLPSTGGMGTTLLYVAGGILVACAAAYVVLNKKRA